MNKLVKFQLFALFLCTALAVNAQEATLSGVVRDVNNNPLIGVNVVQKGTSKGTVTDFDGAFSFQATPESTIVFTYIGFTKQEIAWNGNSRLHITLHEDSELLEEVVVVGYGTAQKVNLTGAVEQVTGKVFENRPITNITQGLVGVIPNLNISPTYGNRPSLTRRFINTYLNSDGTPFTSHPNYKTTPFAQEVKNRDGRLQQTIRMGNYRRTENGVPVVAPPNLDQAYTGYQIIKGCYDERFPYDDESRNENAHIIFRHAEVLLNKAEALAELGRMTDAQWASTIGALRARAGITGPSLTQKPVTADPYMVSFYNNKFTDPVLLEVLRERAVEMITEGLRPDDLLRWRLGELFAQAPMNGMYVPAPGEYDLNEDGVMDVCFYIGKRPADATASVFVDVTSEGVGKRVLSEGDSGEIIWNPGQREWSDKKYFYPIPEADRLKNPNLGQNPGWS